ncbi:MAG: hypothetical protein ABJA02_13755 [Acidobacteriota bacterium]
MSLINCPECGQEVSTTAAACPHCARPINPQHVVERKVVVTDTTPPEEGFPNWAFIPIGLLALILIGVMYMVWGRSEPDTTNVRITANAANSRNDVARTSIPGETTTINPVGPSTVTVPPPVQTSAPSSQTTVPGTMTTVAEPPTKGQVNIEAKVITRTGTQAVRNERFYLLDDDVESILSAAGVQPIEGQTLSGSLGLSLIYPDKYGDFSRNAMGIIKRHVKYAGQTDASGKASVSGVEPKSYYLFGITKVGRGFSLWNSPVSIIAGDNVLTLSPQSVTEIQGPNG